MRPLRHSTLTFNRELLVGEISALVVANLLAPLVGHYTRNPSVISWSAVVGTLIGGGLGWLAARIYDRKKEQAYSTKGLAGDIAFFTPAAIACGLALYDPAIYLVSHGLLTRGFGVEVSVLVGQVVAFGLFALALNFYRFALLKFWGKAL